VPPRFVYWTIIFGGQPTSFRAATRDELVPTFKQIQSKHADAQLRYFARGKLWYSEEEAQAALIRERSERRERSRPSGPRPRPGEWKPREERPPAPGGAWRPRGEGRPPQGGGWKPRGEGRPPQRGGWKPKPPGEKPADGRKPAAAGGHRGRDWRPGGEHKDPRDRFKVPRDVKRRGMARKFGWKKKKEDEK
jgi:hypothetical protein